jgi:hypothetical protein
MGNLSMSIFFLLCGIVSVMDCRVNTTEWVLDSFYLEVQAREFRFKGGQYQEGAGRALFIFIYTGCNLSHCSIFSIADDQINHNKQTPQ